MIITCKACANIIHVVSVSKYDIRPYKCSVCGLVQADPMPSNDTLLSYYQGFSFQKPTQTRIELDMDLICSNLKRLIGPIYGGKRFLDYGGGCGIYAKAALKLGWKAELFDYDKDMVAYGSEALGLPYAYDSLNACKGPYDLIFAFHVVEHWNDVDAHFKTLLERLAPGGRIVFATPNARSIEKWFRPLHLRRYYNLWSNYEPSKTKRLKFLLRPDSVFCWDPPRHLLAWTPKAFKALGDRNCLKTTIKIGYNTSRRFEPRGYVIQPLRKRLKMVRKLKVNRVLKLILALGEVASRPMLILASFVAPRFGEQLYVEFRSLDKTSSIKEK